MSKRESDPTTGELVRVSDGLETSAIMPWQLPPVRPENADSISKYAGELPPAWNLKDHPELDGKEIVIVRAGYNAQGEYGAFVVLHAWMYDPLNREATPSYAILITGAEMIVARILTCIDRINAGTAIRGKLRAAGRSWQLD